MPFTALGVMCDVGSMLIGARKARFKVLGNFEHRKYFHSGTFEYNFPGAFMVDDWDDAPPIDKVHLIMGHPSCGNYSELSTTSGKKYRTDPGEIPEFVSIVADMQPEFFVMDNLPKSLLAFTMRQWASALPEYDLFPEWVSNWGYGNVQKGRNRFYMIGSLRKLKWAFVAREKDQELTLRDVIEDLPKRKNVRAINHLHWPDDAIINRGWGAHKFGIKRKNNRVTHKEVKKWISRFKPGELFGYYNKKGEYKRRPGFKIVFLDRPSQTLSGGGAAGADNLYREDTLEPLTIRERARVQGFPDDFIFQPLDYMDANKTYNQVYKQTSKVMPVQFCIYIARQIKKHLRGKKGMRNSIRIIKPNPQIDEAKLWYCKTVGYSAQRKACAQCWLDCDAE